jgi:hypothetical protein
MKLDKPWVLIRHACASVCELPPVWVHDRWLCGRILLVDIEYSTNMFSSTDTAATSNKKKMMIVLEALTPMSSPRLSPHHAGMLYRAGSVHTRQSLIHQANQVHTYTASYDFYYWNTQVSLLVTLRLSKCHLSTPPDKESCRAVKPPKPTTLAVTLHIAR